MKYHSFIIIVAFALCSCKQDAPPPKATEAKAPEAEVVQSTAQPHIGPHNSAPKSVAANPFSDLIGKYSNEILQPKYHKYYPPILEGDFDFFSKRIGTTMPIEQKGKYLFGEGCLPHSCGSEAAAWALNTETGKMTVIILHQLELDNKAPRSIFSIYLAEDEAMPAPLDAWARENGANESNMEVAIS